MPNEAAQLVSEAILGVDFRTILINNRPYTIYPPTIKIICRGIKEWAKVGFDTENQTLQSVIAQIPTESDPIIRGLSYFIVGDVIGYRWKAYRLYRTLKYGTSAISIKELKEAVQIVSDLIPAQDFFDCAVSAKSATKLIATTK